MRVYRPTRYQHAVRKLQRRTHALEQQLEATRARHAVNLALLHEIIDTAPVGRAIIDPALRHVMLNERLAAINGRSVEAHLGKTIFEVVPQLAPMLEPIYRRVLDQHEAVVNVAITGTTPKDPQRIRHFIASYYPLQSMPGVNVIVEEVTERKEAEAALRAGEERFRAIVETSQDVIVLLDAYGRFTYVSPVVQRVLGYAPDELIGRSIVELVKPADMARVIAQYGDLRTLPGAPVVFGANLRHADGNWRWFRVTRNNQLGNPAIDAVICSLQDLTEQKSAEAAAMAAREAEQVSLDELKASQARLRQIGERLIEVQEAERRHLARELHDEIGQALTALSLLLALAPTLPKQQAEERLSAARQEVSAMIAMVRRRSLELRPVMLDDLGLIPALRAHMARYQEQTGISVTFAAGELSRPLPRQLALAAYRIVQEALTNIARYAAVNSARVQIWSADGQLLIQVEDHGTGFDLDAVLQAGATSGLIGIRERVSLLAGELTIDTAPGQGTRLLASLPFDPTPIPEALR